MLKRSLLLASLLLALSLIVSPAPTPAHTPDPNDPLQGQAPVLKVSDIAKGLEYYKNVLGFQEEFRAGEPANYAGIARGMIHFHLSTGSNAIDKGTIYIFVKQVDKLFAEYKSKGAKIVSEPKDQSYGMREFSLKTPDGQLLCFGEGIEKKEPAK